MNPFALILFGVGFILIVIGVRGSQHNVLAAFKGVKQNQTTITLGGPSNYQGPLGGGTRAQ